MLPSCKINLNMITKVTFPTNLILSGHYKSIDLRFEFRFKRLPVPHFL